MFLSPQKNYSTREEFNKQLIAYNDLDLSEIEGLSDLINYFVCCIPKMNQKKSGIWNGIMMPSMPL